MAEATKLPVKKEEKGAEPQAWHPFESLRREMDRVFDEFDRGQLFSPFRRSMFGGEPFWRR
jgi:HSP20 family protein